MSKDFDFLFDIGGPNGYLTHRVLPEFCARTGATAHYVPVLLGGLMKATGNRPPWAVYADVPAKLAYERLEFQRFIDAHALTRFQMNPHFPINTMSLMRGAVGVQMHMPGQFLHYVDTMFRAMWAQPRNMGDAQEIAAVLREAKLDADQIFALAAEPAVKDQLKRNSEEAVERGVFGAPTFFVGNEMFFGQDRLEFVAEALDALPR